MPDLNKRTILITGSSGLIGTAVCNRLGDRFNVVGFDRAGPPHPPPVAECICVDLTSDQSVREGLVRVRAGYGERIASVIHLAAYYDFSGEPSEKYETITVQGTERLLRELQNFHVEQFIFSSTMLVHAPCEPGQHIDENWPIEPKWDYPKSKVETERLILRKQGKIPVILLRIAGVYDDHAHSIPLANQIQRIYERRLTSKVFPGDISRGQSFVHLDDLIDALERVVEKRKQLPDALPVLIGESETLSYEELQQRFGWLIHYEEWETKQISKAVAKTGAWFQDHMPLGEEPFIKPWMIDLADDHYELDISRAQEVLGWEQKHSLRETLPKMVEALKKDPRKFYRENKLGEPPRRVAEHEPAIKEKGQDMFWSFKKLHGFSLRAREGEIGTVSDFFFDDMKWTVRYVVIDTGSWLDRRSVLIVPQSLGPLDAELQLILTDLTRRKIEDSPPVDCHKPVTRQHEAELLRYYGFSYWWPEPILGGFDPSLAPAIPATPPTPTSRNEPHLQSCSDVKGFHIHAQDGEIGHVEDFIVEDKDWTIHYLVVDTTNWWPGGLVLISPKWIKDIDWKTREVSVRVERQILRDAPQYEATVGITKEFERRLAEHYERHQKPTPHRAAMAKEPV